MAISNIGRQLQDRAAKEMQKMGLELLGGVCHDMELYSIYVGRAAGIQWFLQQIDEIEADKE